MEMELLYEFIFDQYKTNKNNFENIFLFQNQLLN